jgi:hypothetical protein
MAVDRDDIAIGYIDEIEETITCNENTPLDTVDILDCKNDDIVDALDPPMVERLMKFRLIVVDRVDNPKCVVKKFVDIDETTVDIFDPSVVDIVERATCVASKLFPDAVDNVETDSCRLEKLEPATVDTKFILLFTYVITAFVPAVRELLILMNSFPTTVE